MYLPNIISPIIKLTNKCNLSCKFCHYAQIKGCSDMNIELCKNIIKQSVQYNISSGKSCTRIIFHGGEPLLRGISFFREIVEYETILLMGERYHKIDNSIQTNGTLLNDEWINFFSQNHFSVGISLDGDEELNYHKNNVFNLNDIINNYKKMRLEGISCGIISVITSLHTNKARQFYEFCIKNDLNKIGLRYCYTHDSNSSVSNESLLRFLIEFYGYYYDGIKPLEVREFRALVEKILMKTTNVCELKDRKACGGFLTFDELGNVFFCDFVYDKERILGNINVKDLYDIILDENYQHEKERCINNIKSCKQECSLYEVCGGGCYRHDNKNGNNYFCPMFKGFYGYIIEDLKFRKIQ